MVGSLDLTFWRHAVLLAELSGDPTVHPTSLQKPAKIDSLALNFDKKPSLPPSLSARQLRSQKTGTFRQASCIKVCYAAPSGEDSQRLGDFR